jgi:hypothetical protein
METLFKKYLQQKGLWGCGSSGRVLGWQAQDTEFKPQKNVCNIYDKGLIPET